MNTKTIKPKYPEILINTNQEQNKTKYTITEIQHLPSLFKPDTDERLMYVFTITSGEETLHVVHWQIELDKETHRQKQLDIVLNRTHIVHT